MSEELKPCPYCNGTRSINVINFFTGDSFRKCDICGAEAPEAKTLEEAAEKWNTRPAEDALKAEVEELKQQLSDSADEGYAGFMLGIEQMKKKLAERESYADRLKEALSDIATIGFEGKIGDKVARETMRRIANSVSAEKGERMKIENEKIIQATEDELYSYWLSRGWDDVYSFPEYMQRMKDAGCEVIAEIPPPTVFDRITASPEVLAPYFIFLKAVFVTNINPQQQWISTLRGEVYSTKSEAIAATVEKLKEVSE